MKTWIFEATQPGFGNWGKFLVGRMDDREWTWPSRLAGSDDHRPVLRQRPLWSRHHLWVMDLETGEGALFRPGYHPKADLNKHRVWVCPMFEPFLTWLYQQEDLSDESLDRLAEEGRLVIDAPFEMYGYRRPGPRRSWRMKFPRRRKLPG
jgi:hypothetical protein